MTIGAVSDTIGMIRLYRHDTIRPWTYRRHRPFRRRYQFPRWCIVAFQDKINRCINYCLIHFNLIHTWLPIGGYKCIFLLGSRYLMWTSTWWNKCAQFPLLVGKHSPTNIDAHLRQLIYYRTLSLNVLWIYRLSPSLFLWWTCWLLYYSARYAARLHDSTNRVAMLLLFSVALYFLARLSKSDGLLRRHHYRAVSPPLHRRSSSMSTTIIGPPNQRALFQHRRQRSRRRKIAQPHQMEEGLIVPLWVWLIPNHISVWRWSYGASGGGRRLPWSARIIVIGCLRGS